MTLKKKPQRKLSMRRNSRVLALKQLFQSEFSDPLRIEDIIRTLESSSDEYSLEIKKYAKELIDGIRNNRSDIDGLIQKNSAHWKIERMSAVDRNLLRIAIFEMKYAIPILSPGIAINEAIEIAKIYSGTDSASFINGILDQIARGL